MEFGIYIRKGVISTIRSCCRSVSKHPFLLSIMCAFIYMSRSHPYMFSLLVSASPIILCTAALLGTLLLSGQHNIAETEKEKKARYESIPRKNAMYDGNLDEGCCVERYSKSKRDELVKVGMESSLLVNNLAEIRVGSDDGDALSEESRSVGNELESSDAINEKKSVLNEEERLNGGEEMADHYAIISKVIDELYESESEHDRSDEEDCSSSDSEMVSEEEGDDGSDSGSDEASMDENHEMMPILDELHPLLDEDAAQPIQTSHVGSTEQSPCSSISSSSSDSGDETEVPDDEAKKDEMKSVITWTEEDEKNLMEVGSSEMERNQRLERILRRRKNMSMVPEINLLDFENSDFKLNVPPIWTARRNPFDLPRDDYENSAPGSAPSVLSSRRNPFDLPDDDETVDEPHKEIRPPPLLRRRDNFIARPSIFSPRGQVRRPTRFRPFFIAERTVSGESSCSGGVNSGHGTESISSVCSAKRTEGEAPSSSSHCNDHGPANVNWRDFGEGKVLNASVSPLERARSLQKLTIPDFHELDHDIMTLCSQATPVNRTESTAPDHGIVDSIQVETEALD